MTTPDSVDHYLKKVREGKLAKPDRCAVCRNRCQLIWHGSYRRSVIALARTWIIPVKRLYCHLCRRTFALLPSFVVKFHRYARETITFALRALRSRTFEAVADLFMERGQREVAPLTFYFWRRKFA